jgi:hypothetical protein
MITVTIRHHRDGNHLVVYNKPWWTYLTDLVGWYDPRWRWDHWIWTRVLALGYRRYQDLYEIALPDHGCVASAKIWPESEHICWYDDCPLEDE